MGSTWLEEEVNVTSTDTKEMERILIHTLSVPAHAILPKLSNQRIVQQSGGFLLFGMTLTGIEVSENAGNFGKRYIKYRELDVCHEDRLCPVIEKVRIPATCKEMILKELNLLNINEGFLFPELEYQAKNIVDYVDRQRVKL